MKWPLAATAAAAAASGAQRHPECDGFDHVDCPCFLNRDSCYPCIGGPFAKPHENANGDIAQCRSACKTREGCHGISWDLGSCRLWARPCDAASRPTGPYRLESRACFQKGWVPPPSTAPPLDVSGGASVASGASPGRISLIATGAIAGLCATVTAARCCFFRRAAPSPQTSVSYTRSSKTSPPPPSPRPPSRSPARTKALPPVSVRVTCGSCGQRLTVQASGGPCSCRCPCGAIYEFQLGGLQKPSYGTAEVQYPSYWRLRSQGSAGARALEQESDAVKRGVQALLDKTWQSKRTRDRLEDRVMRFEVVMVHRNENLEIWSRFYRLRCQLAEALRQRGGCEKLEAKTTAAADGEPELAALLERARLVGDANELYLFHGTRPSAAKGICDGNFSVAEAGSNAGTRYGPGVYFAEASSKSDEYAKDDKLGIFQGLYGMLLCRVVCGRALYTDEARPPVQQLVDSVVKDGSHHSVLGDREKCRGTYREFVIYDKDQAYPEYLIIYRRVDPMPPHGAAAAAP